MTTKVCVLIVGAGLAGSAALARLRVAAPAATILVADRGGGGACDIPRVILRAADRPQTVIAPWWTDRRLGGAANLWYGQVSRFDPLDFAPNTFAGGDDPTVQSRPWPIDRATLDPYYEFVEALLSPVSSAGALEPGTRLPKGWTAREYVGRAERAIRDALAAGGWAPHAGATCLGGHAWTAAPHDPVTLVPLGTIDATHHARNPVSHTRRAAADGETVLLRTGASVSALEPRGDAVEAEMTIDGRRERVRARTVVLACGVLETVALLGRSGVSSRRLGEGFTFTTEATAYVATDLPRSTDARERAIASMAAISTKRLYAPAHPGLAKGGKITAYDARGFEGDARHDAKIRAATGADPRVVSPPDRVTVKLSFKGESVAWDGKRIVVPDTRTPVGADHVLDYTPHAHDRRLVAHVYEAFAALATLLPGGRLVTTTDNVDGADRCSAHLHGGAIFGVAPEHAVTDARGALFEDGRIFVADASVMPTSGATNSSLTVMAIAARVADAVAARL